MWALPAVHPVLPAPPPCSAPAPGRYKLHVRGHSPGAEGGVAHIRGSPFSIECSDPWLERPLVGPAPNRRPGATLSSLGSDLVLFGGDKLLAAVCHAPADAGEAGQAWQWFPTGEAERPSARKGHATATPAGGSRLLVCGGVALEGEPSELIDVHALISHGTASAGPIWGWTAQGPAPRMHSRPDGSLAPSERSGHSAVALGQDILLIFGGEQQGQLLQELCLLDTYNKVRSQGRAEAQGRAADGRLDSLESGLCGGAAACPPACLCSSPEAGSRLSSDPAGQPPLG